MSASQTGSGQFDGPDHLRYRIVLSENRHLEVALKLAQQFLVVAAHGLWGDPGNLGHHSLYITRPKHLLSLAR